MSEEGELVAVVSEEGGAVPTDESALRKIAKLDAELHGLLDQFSAIVKEIEQLASGGGPAVAVLLKRAEERWQELWRTRYRSGYLWSYARDRLYLKRLLAKIEIEDLERRMQAYLADNDPFIVNARHPFGLFGTQVNRYAGLFPVEDVQPSGDCRHTPRCGSEQEHTKRRMADMRSLL